jgi:hypothetical protein
LHAHIDGGKAITTIEKAKNSNYRLAEYRKNNTPIVEGHNDNIILSERSTIKKRIGTTAFNKAPSMNPTGQ